MNPQKRVITVDNLELQFSVNYAGHFLLVQLLLNSLKASKDSRVVNLSSIAHWIGDIHFDDVTLEKKYGDFKAYAQSKLAMILFSKEITKRYG